MSYLYISLGSNINREYHVKHGLTELAKVFGALTLSSLYESKAVGFDGSDFYNMVIGVETSNTIEEVANTLRTIEFKYGREQQAKKFSPRTLDLDLLLFDELILNTPAQIPRDEITKNAFVLWPLAEIAESLKHPVTNQSYGQLWQNFDKASQSITQIPFSWSHIMDNQNT
ncbi:2-amino-4-hydroxy-6-hydroxymethyldihydropteridine diphosphokinase [Pseudocolwellia agarivorans]|uniref:2-amino-4-hydroxy-6- hydroxymethyldihydropteridine diphosphokinase n=1 Tax=Pseudocolwellia agarivorans TaxID=1911682 RepID=UPI000984C613|nr:2-amino-4-hydroxy-6-hydroxymethyldihydropteridine diphosphokinase [Pseudocolwellia agarivorans]